MKKPLLARLLSRVKVKEYYPTKHKKKDKSVPTYVFISVQYFEVKNPETGVVSIKQVGFTYRKPKEN